MQQLMVGLIVGAAAMYAVWHWLPARLKRRAAQAIAHGSERLGVTDAAGARQLQQSLQQPSGCGACARCEPACSTQPRAEAEAEGTRDPGEPRRNAPV
ncbi:hypothetical protein CCO03_06525 [Comamonas serinivorans]|uniref:Uncharacterized protein n=1 Tax=Comamonas serinivorans TaxID=1082851 RepID=A0A1Y0EL65_9BURK|nr:hypothetical protein [Comamonas serinivorans]ARU04374.1 hypothetical protein CCO03_06525 [Comamonas serinivorans]